MQIFVNDKEISIHNGAKVLDVIRAYYAQLGKKKPEKLPIVIDAYNNSIAFDGELSEGIQLYFINK